MILSWGESELIWYDGGTAGFEGWCPLNCTRPVAHADGILSVRFV